jgi:hypothetical protein
MRVPPVRIDLWLVAKRDDASIPKKNFRPSPTRNRAALAMGLSGGRGMKDWSPATRVKLTLSDITTLRIAGFGACMITGYPHKGSGLFEVACKLVQKRLARPVLSIVVSLGGFPAPRAEKYLKKKVFGFNPKYIVIQLGATDAQCPIRANGRPTSDLRSDGNPKQRVTLMAALYHGEPATALSPLRWQLASVIGHLRKIEPITPLSSYIAAIERMVDNCRSVGIKPVVLSPFVYGSRYTMRKAISYVDSLQELASRTPDVILVDCVSLLANFPKCMILQHDGFHLSQVGHDLVGEAVGQAIIEDIIINEGVGDAGRLIQAQEQLSI